MFNVSSKDVTDCLDYCMKRVFGNEHPDILEFEHIGSNYNWFTNKLAVGDILKMTVEKYAVYPETTIDDNCNITISKTDAVIHGGRTINHYFVVEKFSKYSAAKVSNFANGRIQASYLIDEVPLWLKKFDYVTFYKLKSK